MVAACHGFLPYTDFFLLNSHDYISFCGEIMWVMCKPSRSLYVGLDITGSNIKWRFLEDSAKMKLLYI